MSTGEHRTPLGELATHMGIVPEYLDQTGRERRVTTDDTRRDLLAAMGVDASSDETARVELGRLRAIDQRRLVAPVRVLEVSDPAARVVILDELPSEDRRGVCRLELVLESGERQAVEGEWNGERQLALPPVGELPIGYHRLTVSIDIGRYSLSDEQMLIIVPSRCVTPADLLGGHPGFGLTANLYTLRSESNWGVGDFTDLGSLAEWGASVGADFVGVNPLHALLNRGHDISPYSPVSRLYRNPLYIDVSRVPELAQAPDVHARIASPEFLSELDALRESPNVRYEQVMGVKGLVLDALHRVFRAQRGSGSARDRAYDAYLARRGAGVREFATWMTIAEQHGRGSEWRKWPAELRSPSSNDVHRFAHQHAARVDFHVWLQFEADRQLALAAQRARDAGMRIGVYQDLAIGTSPTSADTWLFGDQFVRGVSVGAPPDPYSATGQNWGLPPLNPRAMRESGYRYFIELVRSAFEHAGALRIDHVMGLFRLFWIPDGKSGTEGAYVRYPSNDLLGIIALESVRNQAIVVGEDLGTVPPDVPAALQKWGILSSKVVYFERELDGSFKPASDYPALALATANTHDLPPLAGFWEGRDIEVRREVGLIASDEEADRARHDRQRERHQLIYRLAAEHVLSDPVMPATPAGLRAAVHAFLCRTPSQLVGLSLDDLAGEIEAVNVPGVGGDKHPSWTRKMRHTLETIAASDDVRTAVRCDGRMHSNRRRDLASLGAPE